MGGVRGGKMKKYKEAKEETCMFRFILQSDHTLPLGVLVGLSFIRRTGVVLLLLLFASFVFLLLSQLLSCALLNLYFRICTLYLLEYDCTS